jgi:hypothetical protein
MHEASTKNDVRRTTYVGIRDTIEARMISTWVRRPRADVAAELGGNVGSLVVFFAVSFVLGVVVELTVQK